MRPGIDPANGLEENRNGRPLMTALALIILGRLALSVALFVGATNAQSEECVERDGYTAEVVTDYLDSWKNVTQFYKVFKKCDDGGVAEGVSDAIARLLSQKWYRLPELIEEIAKTPGLDSFILTHLDETDKSSDLNRIAALAKTKCPATATGFCKKIRSRIDSLGHN